MATIIEGYKEKLKKLRTQVSNKQQTIKLRDEQIIKLKDKTGAEQLKRQEQSEMIQEELMEEVTRLRKENILLNTKNTTYTIDKEMLSRSFFQNVST